MDGAAAARRALAAAKLAAARARREMRAQGATEGEGERGARLEQAAGPAKEAGAPARVRANKLPPPFGVARGRPVAGDGAAAARVRELEDSRAREAAAERERAAAREAAAREDEARRRRRKEEADKVRAEPARRGLYFVMGWLWRRRWGQHSSLVASARCAQVLRDGHRPLRVQEATKTCFSTVLTAEAWRRVDSDGPFAVNRRRGGNGAQRRRGAASGSARRALPTRCRLTCCRWCSSGCLGTRCWRRRA